MQYINAQNNFDVIHKLYINDKEDKKKTCYEIYINKQITLSIYYILKCKIIMHIR